MFKQTDFIPFCELWTGTHDIMAGGKVFSQKHMVMIFEDLEDYSLHIIEQAVKRHRKTAKFAPTPNDIIEIIEGARSNKHIGVEEAWAKALPMIGDEDGSFAVTQEILAAKSLAEGLYLAGDKFSAARAFKEKYAELIKQSPEPVWFVSLGDNPEKRIEAANEAKKLNLISKQAADSIKLGLDKPDVTLAQLVDMNAKKSGNVIAFDSGMAMLKRAINGGITLIKPPVMLSRRHEKWLIKVHAQKANELRLTNPDDFKKQAGE